MSRCSHFAFRSWKPVVSGGLLMTCGLVLGTAAEPAAAQAVGSRIAPPAVLPAERMASELPVNDAPGGGGVHRDPQVMPAGAHLLRKRTNVKKVCPQGGCGLGAQCQGTCVVRPGRFGYYATQWRAWPGDGGVQQTSLEQMTPVSPPASAIPSIDEEALMPSSLMPEEEFAPRGSDNFGFEDVLPPTQTPPLPPPSQPESGLPADGTAPADPPPTEPAPTAPQRPSLFDPPAPAGPADPAGPPAAEKDPDGESKPKESLDNLFDDFGRQSRLRSSVELRQRLALANQQMARRQAEQATTASSGPRQPGALPATGAPQRLKAPAASTPRVVPASAQRSAPAGNPLR